ncbi:MAG: hypothetical protein AB7D05_03755 [Mangrovibacterium sp.]
MEFLQLLLVAIVLMALAFAGLGIKVLLKKKGRFPNIHIGSNNAMRERGIICAQSFDKLEQARAGKEIRTGRLMLSDDGARPGC